MALDTACIFSFSFLFFSFFLSALFIYVRYLISPASTNGWQISGAFYFFMLVWPFMVRELTDSCQVINFCLLRERFRCWCLAFSPTPYMCGASYHSSTISGTTLGGGGPFLHVFRSRLRQAKRCTLRLLGDDVLVHQHHCRCRSAADPPRC